MDIKIVNAIYKYIEVLYENNQKLIRLFGIDAYDAIRNGSKDILDIIQDIPRLIPYYYKKEDMSIHIDTRDGLLQYKKELPDLEKEFIKLIDNNSKLLIKCKEIRNKYEHVLHNIEPIACSKVDDSWFEYRFELPNVRYSINSDELISLFKELNIIYSKLIEIILKYLYDSNIESYRNLCNFYRNIRLLGFNKLYDSDLLREIGKAIVGI